MIEATVTISNKVGIHARPASLLINMAKNYNCDVKLVKGDKSCDLKGIIGLMKLQCVMGDVITIMCDGKDEDTCLEKLVELIKSKFGEN